MLGNSSLNRLFTGWTTPTAGWTTPAGSSKKEGFQVRSENSIVGSLFLLLLLFVLSPGVLLTLPPGKGGIFRSGQTSYAAAFIHALLVVVIFNFI